MTIREVVAGGTWCPNCEMFEVPDVVDGQCMACGCPEEVHRDVEVITVVDKHGA